MHSPGRITVVLAFAAMIGGCSLFDGPTGPFPGGRLRAGDLESQPSVDWATVTRDVEPLFVELQLVEPPRSRTTGAMLYEGELYVPCDLGFIWRRIPAPTRWMLSLIYRVKGWHEDAERDGRVVLRVSGTRYERRAVRVTEPGLLAALRSQLEADAERMLGEPLGSVPTSGPRDIWFFRIDPRDTVTGSAPPE